MKAPHRSALITRMVRESTARCGVPEKVEDPAELRRVAALFGPALREQAKAKKPRRDVA